MGRKLSAIYADSQIQHLQSILEASIFMENVSMKILCINVEPLRYR